MKKSEIINELKRAFKVSEMSKEEIFEKYYSNCSISIDNLNHYAFITGYMAQTIEDILKEEKQ